MKPLGAVNVAALTPQRPQGHEVDLGAALDLIDHLCAAGAQGIALLGATGEFVHLNEQDRIRLTYMAVKRSRVPVIAGVGHSTLAGALALGREACSAGAACLLLMPPYFYHYSQQDVKQFYLEFVSEVGAAVPVLLYNLPFFTTPIEIETALELLGTGRFAGIKDSSGSMPYMERLLALAGQGGFTVLAGNDSIFTRARQAGAAGVVSGVACAAPELMIGLDKAIGKGNQEVIQALEARLQEFIGWIDRFPSPAGIKIAAGARGWKTGALAVPLAPEKEKLLYEFQEWFKAWLPQVRKQAAAA